MNQTLEAISKKIGELVKAYELLIEENKKLEGLVELIHQDRRKLQEKINVVCTHLDSLIARLPEDQKKQTNLLKKPSEDDR